jgi:carboxypeptidase PM20D1
MGSDTMESARAYVEKAVHDSRVSVTIANGTNPSPCSPAEGEAWERLKTVIGQTWPEAVVSPYLMVAASDSRHYAAVSNHVYRFSPMVMTAEERRTIHANNERIELQKLYELVRFYVRLIKLI